MKHVSTVLLILMISFTSFAINEEKEAAKQSRSTSFQPKPLDDEWSKWLIGKWEVTWDHGAAGFTIESVLNGQFLIWKRSWAETDQMTDEEKKQLKEAFKASDEDLERFLSMPYKLLEIYTIDPKTGERIGYGFDSMRCIAEGRGRLEANKEIMEWEWSGTLQGATSIGIIEKISDNKLTCTHKITLPNGNKREEKTEMIRKKIKTEE
jgi:hypothetical protein